MEKKERTNRIIRIFIRIAGSLFVPPEDPFILPMGKHYHNTMSRLLSKRSELFQAIKGELAGFSQDQLDEAFGVDGRPLIVEANELVQRHKLQADQTFGRLQLWYAAPIFRTAKLADFDHWSRSDFLEIDEIVWLSVGLEPDSELIDAIKLYDGRGMVNKRDAVATYMSRHKEVIRRKFDPHDFRNRPDFRELHAWIKEVSLDVHPEFFQMIATRAGSSKNGIDRSPPIIEEIGIDARERTSMSKLIAAMAIDAYGFDPQARRSEIPNEIQGIADRLGLELSANTIRKYLKHGAATIPEDWKPE